MSEQYSYYQMISDLSDDEILEKYSILLLVFLQKSHAHLSTTIMHWLKTNTVHDDTSDLREICHRMQKGLFFIHRTGKIEEPGSFAGNVFLKFTGIL